MSVQSLVKVSRDELRQAAELDKDFPNSAQRDEMAIPSYLHWNPLVRWVVWRRHALITRMCSFSPGLRVLDFGCGPGILLPTICAASCKVHAIDLFPGIARELCRSRDLDVQFDEDIRAIPDNSMDVVIAAEVLEHIGDSLSDLLAQFRRVLRPEGRLVVSVPVEGWLYRVGRTAAGFAGKGDYHHHKAADITEIIEHSRFSETRRKGIPIDMFPAFYIVAEYRLDSRDSAFAGGGCK